MRKLIITLIALTLLLAACRGQETADLAMPAATAAADMDTGGGEDFAAEAPQDEALAFQGDVLENRKIIQEAYLELTDEDTEGLFNRTPAWWSEPVDSSLLQNSLGPMMKTVAHSST